MVVFRQKKIITTSFLGEDLQKARQALNLSLRAVEKKLGISENYLKAIENNDWEEIPGEVYRKNFLKKYADFLGINFDKIKEKYDRNIQNSGIDKNEISGKFGIGRKRFLVLPKIIKTILICILILIIIVYLGWQIASLISPPQFVILYPEERFVTKSSLVKVLGFVKNESWIGLNDNEITVGEDGYFSIDIDLNPGLNIIKFEAKKRHGRSKVIYRSIIVQ
ncbi:MAG: helix-turn-helix domain-containing protein [Candidatus Kuenenbacteria bacterium]